MERVELSKGTIEYRDVGQGPVVLFVHGLLVNGGLWSGIVDGLARAHRCIVPEWPLGSHRIPLGPAAEQSPAGVAALVAEFAAALDLCDVTLVGNDTGGAISQLVAADHGERIARLVLTNCDALESFPPKGFEHFLLLGRIPGALALLMKLLRRAPALGRLGAAYGALAKRPIPVELLRAWAEPGAKDAAVRDDARRFLREVAPTVTLAVAERLDRFRKPVLLLWAREDPFFTLDLAKRLRDRLPIAEIREVDDARTFSPLDQPARLAREIASFASPPEDRRDVLRQAGTERRT